MRNIFIAFLSELHYPSKDKFPSICTKKDIKINSYKAEGMDEVYNGLLTNEAATYYVMDELDKKNENLNKIILICTDKVRKEAIPKQNDLFTKIMKEQINCTEEKYITPRNYYIASVIDYINEKKNEKKFKGYECYECTQKIFENGDDNLPSLFQIISIKDKPQEADIYKCMVKVINSLEDEDKLYIDINGGYRDANAILLGLCRVLGVMKPKVKVEQNIYIPFVCRPGEDSEVVNDITDRTFLFSMFDLISGIDEFSKYGSINKLSEYYKNATGDFKELLISMKKVSDGLKLCFSDKIIQGFESLKQSFNAFKEQRNAHSELEVFLIDYLKRSYGTLINKDNSQEIDLIQLINWCVEHDLVQPALSLCVEKIPDYLEAKKIYYVDAEIKDVFVSIVRKNVRKNSFKNKEWYQIFTNILPKMKNGRLNRNSLKIIIKEQLKSNSEKMNEEVDEYYAILSKLYDDRERKKCKAWENNVRKQKNQAWNSKALQYKKYCKNVNNQTIFSDISPDNLEEILKKYFEIKKIRNASFHNGELKFNKELKDVKNDIRSLLKAIHTSLGKEEDTLHGSGI